MSDDHLLLPGFYTLVCELKKELNKNEEISSWQNLMSLRVRVNEKIEKKFNQELSQYEEKISMKKLFHQCDVPTTRVMYHFPQNSSNNLSEEDLQLLLMETVQQQHQPQQQRILNSGRQPIPLVVAKASHLTTGNCVFILLSDGSVKAPQPVGPGKTVMLENQRKNDVLTYANVATDLLNSLEKNAGQRECKALRECRPGFLMEDYFHHDLELRVATIFGKVIVGASDNGLKIHSMDSGPPWVKYLWPSIVKWSQKLSKGTDYLRIDYFINTKTLEIFASEMNTFPWPESQFFGEKFIEVQKEAYLLGMTKIL